MRRLSLVLLAVVWVSSLSATNLNWGKSSDHVGLNPGTPDGREGGETIAGAVAVPSIPYTDTGNTCDNVDDYDEVCDYPDSNSPDVVYAYVPTLDGVIDIDLCYSSYDTKLYVYEGSYTPGNPYACNDDYWDGNGDCLEYSSFLPSVPVAAGTTYFIVVDGYDGDCGDYQIDITGVNGTGVPGGETIPLATVLTSLPAWGFGNSCDNDDDYDEVCPYENGTAPDVVYLLTPPVDMPITLDLCTSNYDTKLYVYEGSYTPGAPYACNDDYWESDEPPCTEYASYIENLQLTGGTPYYIVVDGYYAECGYYELQIIGDMPPEELTVYPDGQGQWPTIQAGVDAVVDGGTVWLADGIFTGAGNREILFGEKSVTLSSVSGDPSNCIIDCEPLADAGRIPSKPSGRISKSGGAGKPHPFIPENRDDIDFGAMCFEGEWHDDTIVQGITIANTIDTAVEMQNASPSFIDCIFLNNVGKPNGGAVYAGHSSSSFTNCVFEMNSAMSGGAIYAYFSSLTLESCNFIANDALDGGAIVFSDLPTRGSHVINSSLFANNVAQTGGAVSMLGTSCDFEYCTFVENKSGLGSGILIVDSEFKLWMSLLAFNFDAEAIWCDNRAGFDIVCVDIFGNAAGNWVGCIAPYFGVDGNFSEDPQFCGPVGTGKFGLQSDSPCIPANSPCGLTVGALPEECEDTVVGIRTWSELKTLY